jgi:hypothetical protein
VLPKREAANAKVRWSKENKIGAMFNGSDRGRLGSSLDDQSVRRCLNAFQETPGVPITPWQQFRHLLLQTPQSTIPAEHAFD